MYDPNENRFGDPPDQFTRPRRKPASSMAMASVTCAIIAILSVFTVFGALLFGALGIIFALLSRREDLTLERPAKYGLYVAIIALIISAAISVFSVVYTLREYGSFANFYQKYLYTLEENYGIELDPGAYDYSTPDSDAPSDGNAIPDSGLDIL